MRIRTTSSFIVAALLIISFGFPRASHAQANLFEKASAQSLSPNQSSQLSSLQKRPTTAEVNIVRLTSLTLLSQGRAVTLNVFPGTRFTAENTKVDSVSSKAYTWIGEPSKRPGLVVLSVRGDQVTGTIRAEEQLFKVQSLGGGLHAVIRVDESKFPPEHPTEFDSGGVVNGGARTNSPDAQDTGPQALQPNSSGGGFIRVLTVYTDDAEQAAGDIGGLIQTAVAETNQSYDNSNITNIAVTQVQVPSANVEYDETKSGRTFSDHLAYLQSPNDNVMDGVHDLRDDYYADVVILLVDDPAACGLAQKIYATNDSQAFAVVHYDCATGYYSFGHEVGHLQGARHDPAVDPSDAPFSYGHGYVHPGDNWRTVMAYPHACFGCDRLPYWSNPDVDYSGDPMGTAAEEDNARVLSETSDVLPSFRPPPPAITISGPTTVMAEQSYTWTGDVSGGYPPYDSYLWYYGLGNEDAPFFACTNTGNSCTFSFPDPGNSPQPGYLRLQIIDEGRVQGEEIYQVSVYPSAYATTSADALAASARRSLPEEFTVEENAPNPFSSRTVIHYGLPEKAEVDLAVYNMLGQQVRRLASGSQQAGWHHVTVDGSGLSSSVYLYRFRAGGFTDTGKVVVVE